MLCLPQKSSISCVSWTPPIGLPPILRRPKDKKPVSLAWTGYTQHSVWQLRQETSTAAKSAWPKYQQAKTCNVTKLQTYQNQKRSKGRGHWDVRMMMLKRGRSKGSSGTPSMTMTPLTLRRARYSARSCLALTVSRMPSSVPVTACKSSKAGQEAMCKQDTSTAYLQYSQ